MKVIKKETGVGSDKGSIAYYAVQGILNGFDFQQTLKLIKKHHRDTKYSKNCHYWYRRHLGAKHEGLLK